MAELNTKFTRSDLETLIESMGDWEMLGDHEHRVLEMIKGAPMPPEDHEAYDIMSQIKNHYKKREREINASRQVRQERATLLKAKLMLVRMELGTNQFFEMSDNTCADGQQKTPESSEALTLAEFFIRDLGVWDHYKKFLKEKKVER